MEEIVNSLKNAHYANLFTRTAANVIDNVLVSALTFFVMVILTFSSFDVFSIDNFKQMFVTDLTIDNPQILDYEVIQGLLFFVIYTVALYLLLSLIYFQSLLMSNKRATFGMRFFKLKLISLDGDKKLSFNRVFLRNIFFMFLKFIYIGGISLFTIAYTRDKQALHDMALGTSVTVED